MGDVVDGDAEGRGRGGDRRRRKAGDGCGRSPVATAMAVGATGPLREPSDCGETSVEVGVQHSPGSSPGGLGQAAGVLKQEAGDRDAVERAPGRAPGVVEREDRAEEVLARVGTGGGSAFGATCHSHLRGTAGLRLWSAHLLAVLAAVRSMNGRRQRSQCLILANPASWTTN